MTLSNVEQLEAKNPAVAPNSSTLLEELPREKLAWMLQKMSIC